MCEHTYGHVPEEQDLLTRCTDNIVPGEQVKRG